VTGRVLTALLGLATALLAAVVLPLGLQSAAHYRADYLDAAVSKAKAISAVAEERLADHESSVPLGADVRSVISTGEGAVLLDRHGVVLDRAGAPFALPGSLHDQVAADRSPVHAVAGAQLLVAVPVGTEKPIGLVVLARPRQPLQDRIHRLWLMLAAVCGATVLTATALALWLSRWVARPLHRLERTVARVGAGDLDARAGRIQGPEEVRLLAASFDAMATRLSTLVDGHRAVIADVSHELRTPMSALRLRLELLRAQRPTDEPELTSALAELDRLSRMVDGLLAVARAEASSAAPREVAIGALIRERASVWEPLAVERGVKITVTAPIDIRAWVVSDHLEQILDNLLGNCFDLAPPPAHVRLSLSSRGQDAVVSVVDDGPGMTVAQRESAFRRFVTGRSDNGGTGLGLAIVHRLVTSGGGTIELSQTAGGGLTAELTLPRVVSRPTGRPASYPS
jgi:signal transduction histidine kinase